MFCSVYAPVHTNWSFLFLPLSAEIDSSGKSYTADQWVQSQFPIFESLLIDEECQVNGFVMLVDCGGITMQMQTFFGLDKMTRGKDTNVRKGKQPLLFKGHENIPRTLTLTLHRPPPPRPAPPPQIIFWLYIVFLCETGFRSVLPVWMLIFLTNWYGRLSPRKFRLSSEKRGYSSIWTEITDPVRRGKLHFSYSLNKSSFMIGFLWNLYRQNTVWGTTIVRRKNGNFFTSIQYLKFNDSVHWNWYSIYPATKTKQNM